MYRLYAIRGQASEVAITQRDRAQSVKSVGRDRVLNVVLFKLPNRRRLNSTSAWDVVRFIAMHNYMARALPRENFALRPL